MIKLKNVCLSAVLATTAMTANAGGLLTNTNQNIAFNRMMSREASIGIDGVYYNPAGVAFMKDGHHLSINFQSAWQTRTIENSYPLFLYNANNPSANRKFKGEAFAPVIPSFQYAYNKNRWSFQGNFALAGGGGKCKFDDGLGSFEEVVANIGLLGNTLAPYLQRLLPTNPDIVNPNAADPVYQQIGGYGYTYDSYMRGRQYYYGLSLGAAYRISDNLSVYAGVRGIYATCNYYGYVKNISFVGKGGAKLPLSSIVDPNDPQSSDIELNTDQTGYGFTPILGIDYKTGRWNFSAKYEFKTHMCLKNQGTVITPVSKLNNIGANLMAYGVPAQVLQQVAPAINAAKENINELIAEYDQDQNGKDPGDIPALLTLGVGYSPIDALRINVGFHWFDDKEATSGYRYDTYKKDESGKEVVVQKRVDRHKKLKRGTLEYNAGIEGDVNKMLTLSAGWQSTNYGLSDASMDDKSFVVSSNSVGCGAKVNISNKMSLNVAYFHTFYKHKKTSGANATTALVYTADYTRNNDVVGIGLDIDF